MSGFLCIYIKTLDDGEFQFCQTRLISKVLEVTSVPRGASTLMGVVNPLQFSIPVDSKTFQINPV